MTKYKANILKINFFSIFHIFHISIKSISIFISVYQKQYKKDVNDPDNHDGVITHLEPEILECEVKWTLRSITMNKLWEILQEGNTRPLYLPPEKSVAGQEAS